MGEREARDLLVRAAPTVEVGGAADPITEIYLATANVVGAGAAAEAVVQIRDTGIWDIWAYAFATLVVAGGLWRLIPLVIARDPTVTQRQIDVMLVRSANSDTMRDRSLRHRVWLFAGDQVQVNVPGGGLLGEDLNARLWVRRVG